MENLNTTTIQPLTIMIEENLPTIKQVKITADLGQLFDMGIDEDITNETVDLIFDYKDGWVQIKRLNKRKSDLMGRDFYDYFDVRERFISS